MTTTPTLAHIHQLGGEVAGLADAWHHLLADHDPDLVLPILSRLAKPDDGLRIEPRQIREVLEGPPPPPPATPQSDDLCAAALALLRQAHPQGLLVTDLRRALGLTCRNAFARNVTAHLSARGLVRCTGHTSDRRLHLIEQRPQRRPAVDRAAALLDLIQSAHPRPLSTTDARRALGCQRTATLMATAQPLIDRGRIAVRGNTRSRRFVLARPAKSGPPRPVTTPPPAPVDTPPPRPKPRQPARPSPPNLPNLPEIAPADLGSIPADLRPLVQVMQETIVVLREQSQVMMRLCDRLVAS